MDCLTYSYVEMCTLKINTNLSYRHAKVLYKRQKNILLKRWNRKQLWYFHYYYIQFLSDFNNLEGINKIQILGGFPVLMQKPSV